MLSVSFIVKLFEKEEKFYPQNVSFSSHLFPSFVYATPKVKAVDKILCVRKQEERTLINILSFIFHSHFSFIRYSIIHA